ncbi:type IV pilus biogenesis protein PilO [Candidatus Moduliflexus flocculans]|uniref:Type IV pilus biogenesis protein PilO n=1 Tax=Candidatus Moduliflexus flocculans TaxID=1499966 RepID=A0A0S6W3U5_9BACT|nr:type IV pilus biogenesis protein PilO [Candidatus Moduliflexus flocculans]
MDKKKNPLDQFIEFPAKYKYLIVLGIMILCGAAFYYFVYTKKAEEIAALEDQLQKLQVELQKAEAFAARYDEFKEELRLVDLKLKEALKKLPEGKEIPNLLDQINESVIDAGLTISLFKPSGETPQEFYSEVPVEINVVGGYHNLATFADVISKMERIVTLRDIKIAPDPTKNALNIACTAVTFRQAPQEAPPAAETTPAAPATSRASDE